MTGARRLSVVEDPVTRVADLIDPADVPPALAARPLGGISADSRSIRPGDAFFAIPGVRGDGLAYVDQAVAKGAAIIVAERAPGALPPAVGFVRVADSRAALSRAAARFYPRQPGTIVAVTGTSGKTSVAFFARQLWARLGFRAASVGTIGIVSDAINVYGSLTTPDPVALHRSLDELARSGITHLAMEASSHGLDQKRLDGVRLAAAAFTNISRDHLDYHATPQAYMAAKLRLFGSLLAPGAPVVVDPDEAGAAEVMAVVRARALNLFDVGAHGAAIRLRTWSREGFATRLALSRGGREYDVRLPLTGDFQVANALVAAGLCIATGGDAAAVFKALERLEGAPGRLERIGERRGAPVFVDYAHKPDALEKALATLRPFVPGRLILVFGCGGDRDAGKRPIMGEIAHRLADVVIVTDDNPRSENPTLIRAAILAQAPGAIECADRMEAITRGVAMLESGDALLIAGKGHETGQIIGDRTLPFSDGEAARAALKDAAA
jgi:UDP-N-acetylmuramoyl-L-alanyl-D-glutamate--2,6-diaminopimelate ligase